MCVSQKKAAIQTLTKINAPSSIDRLVDYFAFFQDREIRRELLRSVAIISPTHPKTLELITQDMAKVAKDNKLKGLFFFLNPSSGYIFLFYSKVFIFFAK